MPQMAEKTVPDVPPRKLLFLPLPPLEPAALDFYSKGF